jgi:hypothetical protein
MDAERNWMWLENHVSVELLTILIEIIKITNEFSREKFTVPKKRSDDQLESPGHSRAKKPDESTSSYSEIWLIYMVNIWLIYG